MTVLRRKPIRIAALAAFVALAGLLVIAGRGRDPGSREPTEPHNCRFWSLVGVGYPPGLIDEHLRSGTIASLKGLSHINRDGWGIASFPRRQADVLLRLPLIRRGGPAAYHPGDPDFDLAVEELEALRPRAVVAHVRLGSSGHWGVPDPHPFQHEGYLFAHNGGVPVDRLVDLLTRDDEFYLNHHPPDWKNGYVDSELYFLYLLKRMRDNAPEPAALSLVRAVEEIITEVGETWLNFALTRGDTLYVLRSATHDAGDPVRYFPADPGRRWERSRFWVAASQVVGSDDSRWGTIPPKTLAVFVPGREPEFYPVTAGEGAAAGEGSLDGAPRRRVERSGDLVLPGAEGR